MQPTRHPRARTRKPRAAPDHAPRKRPVQDRSKTMVEMIMRATARVLIRDGYEALTTNQVAREAGASVGSLYQYFSSKQQLVAALLEQHVESTMKQLRRELPALSLLPLPAAVRRFVELMIDAHKTDPALHRVFVEQLPRVGDFVMLEATLQEGLSLTEAYLRAHAAEIAPKNHALTAFMLVHTVESLTHMAVLSRPELLEAPEFVSELSAWILGYLQKPPQPAAATPA